jgi:hypothetical protein
MLPVGDRWGDLSGTCLVSSLELPVVPLKLPFATPAVIRRAIPLAAALEPGEGDLLPAGLGDVTSAWLPNARLFASNLEPGIAPDPCPERCEGASSLLPDWCPARLGAARSSSPSVRALALRGARVHVTNALASERRSVVTNCDSTASRMDVDAKSYRERDCKQRVVSRRLAGV